MAALGALHVRARPAQAARSLSSHAVRAGTRRTDHDLPRTLVTGATGFIGRTSPGSWSSAATRSRDRAPRSDLDPLERLGVTTVRADVRDRHAVRRAMRDVDRVFHTAGTTNLRLAARAGVRTEPRGDPDRARGGAAGRRRAVVYTSSVAAIGPAASGRPRTSAAPGTRRATRSRTSTPSTRPRSRRSGCSTGGCQW